MTTSGTKMRSSLAATAALAREPDPNAARRAARDAWHRDGLILINTGWLSSWPDRKQAELLAEKVHGKRKVAR